MPWQVTCFLNNAKGLIPFRDQLRRLKRSLCGFEPGAERDAWTIREGIKQINSLRPHVDLHSATVLEVGSGWQPLIPMLFSLAGARRVIMTDLNPLLDLVSFRASVKSLVANEAVIQSELGIDPAHLQEFVREARADGKLDEVLGRLRMEYRAPCDMRQSGMAPGSVDVVVSRAVLEHIPPEVIQGIFIETARILKPGGITCHLIDNSDHWEHVDHSLSRINFLKYSDAAFRLTYISDLHYQNRLRHSQYRQMLDKAGLEVVVEETEVDDKAQASLQKMTLAPRFRQFSEVDLATITSFYIARPAAAVAEAAPAGAQWQASLSAAAAAAGSGTRPTFHRPPAASSGDTSPQPSRPATHD